MTSDLFLAIAQHPALSDMTSWGLGDSAACQVIYSKMLVTICRSSGFDKDPLSDSLHRFLKEDNLSHLEWVLSSPSLEAGCRLL